jgi:ABC-2 type transport system ATP-binding protein
VLREQAANGVAVVFSSHQLDLVEGLCERVVIIDNGRMLLEGTVDALTTADKVLVVRVAGETTNDWARSVPDTEVLDSSVDGVRMRLHPGATPTSVLDAARATGEVLHFSFERKRLSEVFHDAVVGP